MLRKLFPRKGVYYGPVAFANGSHYPARNGHPVLKQRLLWNHDKGVYEWARPADPTHQHLYERNVVELPFEGGQS